MFNVLAVIDSIILHVGFGQRRMRALDMTRYPCPSRTSIPSIFDGIRELGPVRDLLPTGMS